MPGFEVSVFQTLPRGDIAGLVYSVRDSDTRAALHLEEQAADRRAETPIFLFVRETGLAHRIYTVRSCGRARATGRLTLRTLQHYLCGSRTSSRPPRGEKGGIMAYDRGGGAADTGVCKAQARQVFSSVRALVEAGGGALANV